MELRRKFKSEPLSIQIAKVLQQSDFGKTADEIASMTGSTSHQVMQIVNRFKNAGMVTVEGNDKNPTIKVTEKGKEPA